VPDVETFLKLIGRNLIQYTPKITSWKHLFTLDSKGLKELGIGNARARRYLLGWTEKYRTGEHGIGGDLKFVENGVAELRVVQIPMPATVDSKAFNRNVIVNIPAGGSAEELSAEQINPVKGLKLKGLHTIAGPHVIQVRGGKRAKIEIKEGMWGSSQGRKIDGGERRQAQVRAKRRGEERRAANGGAR